MSLILEALKKLDREKQSPERGFLVVAAASWPAKTRKPLVVLAVAAVLVVALAAAVIALRRPQGPVARASASQPASAAPSAAAASPAASAPAPASPPQAVAAASRTAPTPRPPAMALPAFPASAPPPRPAPLSSPAAAATPPPLVLQAISSRDGKPIALVSDRLVREGDAFDGVTIVRIGDAEVEVEWKGQRSILRF